MAINYCLKFYNCDVHITAATVTGLQTANIYFTY